MVKMSEQADLSGDYTGKEVKSAGGFNINPLDILFYLLRNWYWFALSIAIFGGWAYYQYAKIPFTYSRSATVMIKDPMGRGSANLDRLSQYNTTNVSNEILQFQSHKLMRDAVERLNANVNYVVMDGLREKDIYNQGPVTVTFENDETKQPANFKLKVTGKELTRTLKHANVHNVVVINILNLETIIVIGTCRDFVFRGIDGNIPMVAIPSIDNYRIDLYLMGITEHRWRIAHELGLISRIVTLGELQYVAILIFKPEEMRQLLDNAIGCA